MKNHKGVMTIGAMAKVACVAAPTIRYYEHIGLLPAPPRSESGQRRYDEKDCDRLIFIRRAREFGFSIAQVRILAGLSESTQSDCQAARDVAADHLAQVQIKLASLRGFEAALKDLVAKCDAMCFGGPGRDCVVVGAMQSERGASAFLLPQL